MEHVEEKETRPRKLDVAESASIDLVLLNNKIVKMRPIVKKAKYQTIQKMIRTIEMLRKKKGSEEQLEKNKRKVDRMLEDIEAIKTFRENKVSKFALANTATFNEICKRPDVGAETRGLARLAEHQAMKSEVKKFRDEHDDWKSLVEYLLGHVARRFYKNKYKVSKFKMATNVIVGNQLMKSYLENKVGQNSDSLKTDDDIEKVKVKNDKKSQKLQKQKGKEVQKTLTSEDDTQIQSESTFSDQKSCEIENESKHLSDQEQSDSEENESYVESEKSDQMSEGEDEDDSDGSDEVDTEASEQENDTKIHGEMVVKKLNMEDLANSDDVDIPDFLVAQDTEGNKSEIKKSKDSFFMREDGENSDEDVSTNNPAFRQSDSDSDLNDEEKQDSSRHSMSSSFIGALNARKSKSRNFDGNYRGGRGRGAFNKFDDRNGRSNFNKFGQNRGRGGLQNFERRGRGRFPGNFGDKSQRPPREFQKTEHRGRGRGSFQSSGNTQNRRGGHVQRDMSTEQKDTAKSTEKIHPSWEASKKRKEHTSIQAFQGKKIKFDDD